MQLKLPKRLRPITQTFFSGHYPIMFGFSLGIAQQKNGPIMLNIGIGHRVWRWRLKEAKINAE